MALLVNQAHPRASLAMILMHRVSELALDLTGITGLSHLSDAQVCRVSNQLIVLLESGERALSRPSDVYEVTAKYQVPLFRPVTV